MIDESNITNSQSTTWPPTPTSTSTAVWPPPPTTSPTTSVPFKNIYVVSKGYISDFRVGTMAVYGEGITIAGKTVMSSERQYWWLVVLFFVRIWLIAAVAMEYWLRKEASLALEWRQISRLVFQPKKRNVCIAYTLTDDKGRVKEFSLATKLTQPLYDAFTSSVAANAPPNVEIVGNGKLSTSFRSAAWYSLLTCWLIVAAVAAIVLLAFPLLR